MQRRQFKLIYRHKYGENPQVPDKVLEDFAGEVFNMYKDPDTGFLNIEDLEDAISLCGIRLEDDELRLFAKECKPDNNTDIQKKAFCNAISVIMNSRNLNSDFVVKVVLTKYFQESCGKNVKDVSLKEIKHFFEDFHWHFTNDDINDFLWEAKYILEDIGTMEITELAGMVKNTVKDYPH